MAVLRMTTVKRAIRIVAIIAVIAGSVSTAYAAAAQLPESQQQRTTTPFDGQSHAIALPGHFDVVDYRTGGGGVGYADRDQDNLGAAYRDDAVDIQASQGSGSPHNVGWIESGEWLAYDVVFDVSTTYTFVIRVSTIYNCRSYQRFHIELDGVNETGTVNVPNTGGWQQWTDVETKPVYVDRGIRTLRIVAENGGFNLASVDVREVVPEPAATQTLPGRVEAEDYRSGGDGIGFRDYSPGNHCGAYRADDVDIQFCDDQDVPCHSVGWIRDDEWLAYNVSFEQSGEYQFVVRTATELDGRMFHIELNGTDVTGQIAVPNTGGWQQWIDVTTSEVAIPAGNYTMKIVADTGRFNINYLDVGVAATSSHDRLHTRIGILR